MSKKNSIWYSIRRKTAIAAAVLGLAAGTAAAGSVGEVYIYGEIGDSWYSESVSANDFRREIEQLDVQTLVVRISSIGGSCPDGIAIYNALKRHPATIHVAIDSWACSVASLIAMAGDTVEMPSNTLMMIHGPSMMAAGNSNELRRVADMLDVWADAMSTSYAAKTGKPKAEMLALLTDGADHWYTAEEAVAMGLADISTEAVPVTASLDISRFSSIPAAAAAFLKDVSMPQANPAARTPANPAPAPAANPAPAPVPAAEADIRRVTLEAETQRRVDVRAAFAPFMAAAGVADLLRTCEDNVAVSAAAAREQLLQHLGQSSQPVGAQVETLEDETDKYRSGVVAALLHRAGVHLKDAAPIAANPYRGYRMLDIARASLERRGIKMVGLDPMSIVAMAFTQTTGDFPVLLENAMHKALLAAWKITPDTWSRFCAIGSVSDFRAHNRYRIASLGNLDDLSEAGEFKTKAIPDGEKAEVSIGTKGYIINLTRHAIINDDLGAFIGLATAQGRAAKRTVEALVYALLASNPLLKDGHALYSAEHGNLLTGAAPSVESFDAARVAMAQQKDVGGNDFLDISPSIWLGPIGLGGTARVINGAQYDPDTANKLQRPNKVAGLFGDVVDTARLTGTAWYTFAAPDVAPAIEVDFLDGNQEPFLEQQNGFTVDGTQYKVRLDVGATAIDYRGTTKNPGA
ncbi:MAG: Clp protease ClpP [Alcaligenaceae bacterium]|nr:Clp protease ClpP [Alcaligenaceae bacterium SAGV5]MPS51257.1 Clp protease ClpP [Alcaligenaceae bacterium SAGV3]MPT57246.1 Clp protease ClpP [Alcaligenaceae bacterium]